MADPDPAAPLALDHVAAGDDIDDHTDPVEDEVLVEEISIDGMCGVY